MKRFLKKVHLLLGPKSSVKEFSGFGIKRCFCSGGAEEKKTVRRRWRNSGSNHGRVSRQPRYSLGWEISEQLWQHWHASAELIKTNPSEWQLMTERLSLR